MPPASDAVTLERLVQLCETHERVLRWQYPEGALPQEWEDELARWPADSIDSALERLGVLKHFYRLDDARRNPMPVSQEDAEAAARQLLRREPVEVDLGTRVVHVTSRSYAAMYEIARHHIQIRQLDIDLTRAGELFAATEAELRARPRQRRGHLRRRLKRLQEVHRRLFSELQLQRRALYAHAFTPHGGPARSLEDAPSWWEEIDPAADALLLAALMAAGPGRYARLGPPPRPRGRQAGTEAEDFGWHSLFASIERQHCVEPASLYDRDLFQLLAWVRAGAPPAPPELED